MTETLPVSVTPQIRSRAANFDYLFSAILNSFLDGALEQLRGKSRILSEELAPILAAIACSPADSCALMNVALKSIPFAVEEAFGRPPWSWQDVANKKDIAQTYLETATGVYAYHVTNINKGTEQIFYVGQTIKNFAKRWAEHARRRKATKRPKLFSSKFYGKLKLTRPRDIHIFVLADVSVFQEDVAVHQVMATVLEAGFCVFFASLRHSKLPRSDESITFASCWSAIPSLPSQLFRL